jgi:undecaprenyl-diphosphatase
VWLRARGFALFASGVLVFEGSRMLVRRKGITATEERVFRAANEASDAIKVPVRAVMQAGTFVTVPIASAVAFLTGRRRLAARLVLGGTGAWVLAKGAKPLGGRPRPEGVLDDVRTREGIEGDLGWVSGHTAVATTLALIAAPEVPAWARPVLGGVVATTGFGRMYVGAHLPLDLVGGAGFGMMISSVVRWLPWLRGE